MPHPTDRYHAHVYYDDNTRYAALQLHQNQNLEDMRTSAALPNVFMVCAMQDRNVGPHPKPQFEIYFLANHSQGQALPLAKKI